MPLDCGVDCQTDTTGVVGTDLAPGLWQWARESMPECVFIAVAPRLWPIEGSEQSRTDELWWLDARAPIVLAEGEAVVGYAPAADPDQMVLASRPVSCILEHVGTFTSSIDVYAQRHEVDHDDSRPDTDVTHSEADWTCYAHVGPEPATELNWSEASPDDHADVSCVVGEGIAAGWWRWHTAGDACTYLVTQDADDPDRQRLRRRDATERLLLTAGESVWGYSDSADDMEPFTISTTVTQCILQFVEAE